jgi:hypothetical protein
MSRASAWLGCLLLLSIAASGTSKPMLQIFEPQAGAETPAGEEIVISMQGKDFPKNDKHAELLLDGKKLRNIPLPKVDGEVFNITVSGIKKGKHTFDVSTQTLLNPP